jgi:hypothetical protein
MENILWSRKPCVIVEDISIYHFIIGRYGIDESISYRAIILFPAADIGSASVCQEDISYIQDHIIADRLVKDFLLDAHLRSLAFDHHKRSGLTVIHKNIGTEHLAAQTESCLAHHHMGRNLTLLHEDPDAPLPHLFFRSKSHFFSA